MQPQTSRIEGPAATAERMPLTDIRKPAEQACLAAWLINAPGQSPAWSHYLLSVCHLRPIEGAPPAHIRIEGATHELILCALDSYRSPNIHDRESIHYLTPLNAEAQFIVATDEQATSLGEKAVRAICDGAMPAEAAFPQQGRDLWQGVVTKTAEHMLRGGHEHCQLSHGAGSR